MRLIGPQGEQLGVLPTQRALAHAQDLGYDLVEIAPNAVPPVAKILDFGKYRFEKQQEAKEAKKRQKSVTWKEIRVTPKIDEHDIETKIKSASKFLAEGDKLKLTVRFRGRELAHPDRGRVLLIQIADRLKEHGLVERQPLLEGRAMSLIMNPLRGAGATPPPAATPSAGTGSTTHARGARRGARTATCARRAGTDARHRTTRCSTSRRAACNACADATATARLVTSTAARAQRTRRTLLLHVIRPGGITPCPRSRAIAERRSVSA
ncbi:MAG: translation initiation factor IF-3 [Chloroflexi bacterium 13_1_40CM_4_68_4]|nr:MAG: translation initiation factor IF-3 [Chloroflexi bacterium 13_1_40CM_4_68_4]